MASAKQIAARKKFIAMVKARNKNKKPVAQPTPNKKKSPKKKGK